ncbi:MAG: hypothetical protein K6F97_06620, partial [Lachnospiraceae bacterium]|nr:hypothetical protein [Lachnospiraceae bacterium]
SMTGCSEAAKEQKETTAVTTTRTTAVEFADDEASSEGGNYISPKGEIVLGEYKGVSAVKTDNGQSTSTDKDWQERVMLKVILNSTYTGLSHADIQDYVDETLEFNKKICDDGGYEFGEYLALTYDMSEDEFEDAVKATGEYMVKLNLALNKIAEKENYSIDADELKAGAETYAGLYGYEDVDSFKKVVSDDVLTQMLLNDKAYNYVIENAVTEQVQVETTVVNGAE